jgi:cell division protein FtsZ
MQESQQVFEAKIKIFGVGGGGNNALNMMIGSGLKGVDFVGVNTDIQALRGCRAEKLLPIGVHMTHGLGAGNDPEVGARAAQDSIDDIDAEMSGADLVFVTAGKGGGTGTGAAPVIASSAREHGALTVGVVTRPFTFEGRKRAEQAEAGIEQLRGSVDTLIVIHNDSLLEIAEDLPVVEAFRLADDVLCQGVLAITELITRKGEINVDFADLKHVLEDSGTALIGIGLASGKERARQAALSAIDSPLLESSIDGATRVLMNITGGGDLSLFEVNEVAEVVAQAVDPEANMIFGAVIDEDSSGQVKVTVVASGFRERRTGAPRAGGVGVETGGKSLSAERVDIPTFLRNR